MLDLLYQFVTPWATANAFQITKNRIIGRAANYLYPFYCAKTKIVEAEKKDVIVSLTSYPARMKKIHLCLNSLLRQSVAPKKIILWLASSQFPGGKGISKEVWRLTKNGLEIRFCEDIRSYKKIYYAAQEYPNTILVTADDDTLYPESWLANLLKAQKEYPHSVVCYRANEMLVKNKAVLPYNKWNKLSPGLKGPMMRLVPIGVGGVLYPPDYFENVEFSLNVIKELCPLADDLWLKTIGIIKKIPAVKVNPNSKEWFTIRDTQTSALMKRNVDNGKNDIALRKLFAYYNIDIMSLTQDQTEKGGDIHEYYAGNS